MMKRILGFCGGCCATAGVLAGPDSDINIVALSSEAQDLLCQLDALHGGIAAEGGLSSNVQFNMASLSLFYDASVAPRLMHRKPR
jgi:hypothetical protein